MPPLIGYNLHMNNKPIKLVPKNNGTIYFFSDAHLNHNRPWIVEKRGFKNVQEHDDWILEHLYNLKEDDILVNLGDFSLMSTVEYTDNVLANIKATHYYINGNHESFMSKIYFREVDNQFLDIAPKTEVYPLVYHPRFKKNPVIFMGFRGDQTFSLF